MYKVPIHLTGSTLPCQGNHAQPEQNIHNPSHNKNKTCQRKGPGPGPGPDPAKKGGYACQGWKSHRENRARWDQDFSENGGR